MKIHILSTAYPYRGGIAVFTERLARELYKFKNDVKVTTFSLQYPNFLFPGKSQYSDAERPHDLNIKPEVNSINPLNWIKVGLKIKKQKPDILILKYWIPFLAPCLGTISRIVRSNGYTKVIVIIDNLIPHEKRFGDYILNRFFVKSVDAFVAMSSSVYKDLEKFSVRKKVLGVHPIYDNFGTAISKHQALSKLELSDKYKYILFFGIIRKYKGLDILLNAFSDNRIQNKNIKLIIAGEFYEESQLYFDLIKRNMLSKSIVLKTHFIPDNEVVNYFCAADIIVQPYRNATQSGVTQIAYHFEKPMLVTDVGGLKEIVINNKTGYVCKPNSQEVADCLFDFFSNNRKELFVKSVKEEKSKYSWDKMVNMIQSLYNDLV